MIIVNLCRICFIDVANFWFSFQSLYFKFSENGLFSTIIKQSSINWGEEKNNIINLKFYNISQL
jgi:hypothetical protein